MALHRGSHRILVTCLAGGLVAIGSVAAATAAPAKASARAAHVLLLSVDGMHQGDLAWYVNRHPDSALASLTRDGVEFANARTPFPSDSFPGMVGLVTGGNPASTGVYYDDSWNASLLPAGTKNCATAKLGAEVTYFEQLDRDMTRLDAGQGVAGLPTGILKMTGTPKSVIDPKQLPVDPATCKPVYPNEYLKVNTVFEVARAAGLRTAWVDKHPAYEILNGPSGTGIQDEFTPEINSDAPSKGASNDWTSDNELTMRYDGFKVQAVLNEIAGMDHSGTSHVGTPAIFGMNFQSVSTAEKLPVSDGLAGGYLRDGVTPGPLLRRALGFIDAQVASFQAALKAQGLDRSTVIILTAKHGQAPQNPLALTRIDDGAIVDALNAAWKKAHPSAGDLVAFAIDDDAMLIWLHDRSAAATSFAKSFLLGYSGSGNGIDGGAKSFVHSGLQTLAAGAAAAAVFHVKAGDPRVPDLVGMAQYGVVYTGKKKKISEHGGSNAQDRWVPLVVSGLPVRAAAGMVSSAAVETTQVAPTILRLLGLSPDALQAVKAEGTKELPLR